MKIQERTAQVNKVEVALSPQPGSEVRSIAFCSSPPGTGKTQFIKHFVFEKRAQAMKYGRVIVRCCDKTESGMDDKWLKKVREDCATNSRPSAGNSTDEALCELIRTHVESVTGSAQTPSNYRDPHTAYATWMSETARHFNITADNTNVDALVIIDTGETLSQHDHKSLVHKHSGKPYTLLEAFCLAVPSPYGILVVGCDIAIELVDPTYLSKAQVTDIGPLAPLSDAGSRKALEESWGTHAVSFDPRVCLSGGVPRLLRQLEYDGMVTEEWLQKFTAHARAQYPIHEPRLPRAYTCLLTSSTKARISKDEKIVVNPLWTISCKAFNTYNDAIKLSIGSYDDSTRRFMMPPITMVDVMLERHKPPIRPSDLHPFLKLDVLTQIPTFTDEDRVRVFVPAFLQAVYARYLLASWESNHPWVSLEKVFEGAVRPDEVPMLRKIKVNLSRGVKIGTDGDVVNSVAYAEQGDASYDASLWCRDTTGEFPLQLLLVNAAAHQKHLKQAYSVRPTLCVDLQQRTQVHRMIMIHPKSMCSVAWMLTPVVSSPIFK
ncbi:Bodo-specific multi-copy gene family, putative [Bodo saltans]|uniref:Bodo-specific multi-copy gene family, putative n=1 Tax=Bodo saltans TaxID=75058 RepID=A0A0S4JD33_BODSA|nr:Bodo-specific multi-copy gene family, putative [Bodo saltans]|eukprot:CUG89378.1 Bodo-specific multi-copy gene family, putative [Bodo saltans]